jgi:hypothetical protein
MGSVAQLLASGLDMWLINVLTFSVWYWEFDRGRPTERARAVTSIPTCCSPR